MKDYIYKQRNEFLVLINFISLITLFSICVYLNWSVLDDNIPIILTIVLTLGVVLFVSKKVAKTDLYNKISNVSLLLAGGALGLVLGLAEDPNSFGSIIGFTIIIIGASINYFQVLNVLLFHNHESLKELHLKFMHLIDDQYVDIKIPKVLSFKKYVAIKITDVLENTTEDYSHYPQYRVIESGEIEAILVLKDGREVSFINNVFEGNNDKIDYLVGGYTNTVQHATHNKSSVIEYNEVAFKIKTSTLEQFPVKSIKIRKKGKPILADINLIY